MRIVALAVVLCSLLSCNNELDTNDEWSDVTIIYGLLDPTADTNWVRVQRGFLGREDPALSFSVYDSLYYKNIDVVLESFEVNDDGSLGARSDSFAMIKDDVSRKIKGDVYNHENHYVFRTQEKLNDRLKYKVSVLKKDGGPTASAITALVEGYQSDSAGYRFKTPDPASSPPEYIGVLEWYSAPRARIYRVDVNFLYREFDLQTKEEVHKEVKVENYAIIKAMPDYEYMRYAPPRNELYKLLSEELPTGKPGKLNFFEELQFEVWAASRDLSIYAHLNSIDPGIHSYIPELGGIENGTGLFASRTMIRLEKIALHTDVEQTYYLANTLCNKGFAAIHTNDTCYCEYADNYTRQVCLSDT